MTLTGGYTIVSGLRAPGVEGLIDRFLPWIVEAGNPFYAAAYGSFDQALRVLGPWPLRPSSEIYLGRILLAMDAAGQPLGVAVAMPGRELRGCRNADAMAVMAALDRQALAGLMERLRSLQGLFLPLGEGDYYWSKLGVSPQVRRQGIGRRLAEEVIVHARAGGFRRVILEVREGNQTAERLYASLGYATIHRAQAPDGGFAYLTQALEL